MLNMNQCINFVIGDRTNFRPRPHYKTNKSRIRTINFTEFNWDYFERHQWFLNCVAHVLNLQKLHRSVITLRSILYLPITNINHFLY